MLEERTTYEDVIDAACVGQVGGHSRQAHRHAFAPTRSRSSASRYTATPLNAAFARFKELADRKVHLTDADLEAIVAEEIGTALEEGFALDVLEVQAADRDATAPGSSSAVTAASPRLPPRATA